MSQPKAAKAKKAPVPTDIYTLLLGLAALALLIGCILLYVDLELHKKEGTLPLSGVSKVIQPNTLNIALLECDS